MDQVCWEKQVEYVLVFKEESDYIMILQFVVGAGAPMYSKCSK